MDCNYLSNISSGTTWPVDVTDLCLGTSGCAAVTIYYSTSYNEYKYCLYGASARNAQTTATAEGPQGSACLGIFYSSELRWSRQKHGWKSDEMTD